MVPEARAWIMFGPDSKVVNLRSRPSALVQPWPLATKIGAAPTIGITPTRTGIPCAKDEADMRIAVAAAATAVTMGRNMGTSWLREARIVHFAARLRTYAHGRRVNMSA